MPKASMKRLMTYSVPLALISTPLSRPEVPEE
ncbi:hypothetical protein SMD44_08306 [Streptomyces alboflavus]|uniref:Uncharacterized protein n=1 Tax=Streptomyces alboflavus TaxID=67267 RepID=A0A1Z1WR00_9ACTN|nr:hypothetical protein SMD44_08306 [Streptomyces alboflavus]